MTQIPFAIIMIPYLEITYFKFCYITIVLDLNLITKQMIVITTIIMDQESKDMKVGPEITGKSWPTHPLSDLFRISLGVLNPPHRRTEFGVFKGNVKTAIKP